MQSLRALFGAFSAEATDDLLRGYAIGVGDLDPGELQSAVVSAIRECDHLPRPVELRKLAGAHFSREAQAMAAWGDILRAVPLGAWKSVNFTDPRVNASVRVLGGWPAVVERFVGNEEEKWLRLEFIKTYLAIGNSVGDEQCKPLMGLSQQKPRNGKLVDPEPIRVGCDPVRAIGVNSLKQVVAFKTS